MSDYRQDRSAHLQHEAARIAASYEEILYVEPNRPVVGRILRDSRETNDGWRDVPAFVPVAPVTADAMAHASAAAAIELGLTHLDLDDEILHQVSLRPTRRAIHDPEAERHHRRAVDMEFSIVHPNETRERSIHAVLGDPRSIPKQRNMGKPKVIPERHSTRRVTATIRRSPAYRAAYAKG